MVKDNEQKEQPDVEELNQEESEQFKNNHENINDFNKKFQFYERLRRKFKKQINTKTGSKSNKLTDYLFLLPDLFFLLLRLLAESRISLERKGFVAAIIGYVMLPIDILPDVIPVIGYVDDLVLVVYGLNILLNKVEYEIIEDNWSGDENLLDVIRNVLKMADRFLNKSVFNKIKRWFGKK